MGTEDSITIRLSKADMDVILRCIALQAFINTGRIDLYVEFVGNVLGQEERFKDIIEEVIHIIRHKL